MKKNRKEKKVDKNEAGLGKKKWAVWKTIVTVISAVVAIVGVTVLGVYLAGGFNEKIVNPESISFDYDPSLFNANIGDGQLEVTDDFELVITSQTEDVTETQVELSFLGDLPVTTEDGYISNTIIRVPQFVTLNVPFTVTLEKSALKDDGGQNILDASGYPIQWITGGIATLVARSEYQLLSRITIQIAVDVPVYATELEIYNSQNINTNQIVTNEAFTVQTKFIPSRSKYMFSDDKQDTSVVSENNRRVKRSYYAATFDAEEGNLVSPVYDSNYDMHFVAGASASENAHIDSYTFVHADTQLSLENEIGEEVGDNFSAFYNAMIVYLAQNNDENISSQTPVIIGEASIGSFTVGAQEVTADYQNPLRLYLSNYIYEEDSKYLNAVVRSTAGNILEGMLGNIAIAFRNEDGVDPTTLPNPTIRVLGGESVVINGITYYKPNTQVADLNYSYWDITSTEIQDIQLSVVLIENTQDGPALFQSTMGEALIYNVSLYFTEGGEEKIEWANQADINVMLQYDESGRLEPYTLNLSQYKSVPVNNTYQDVVFFAYFGEGNIDDLIPTVENVIGATGYLYNQSGLYSTETSTLLLFALNGDSIQLINTGSFRLYYATVKDKDSPDGLYDIAQMCEGYVNVICEKSLYDDSVISGEFDGANFQEINNVINIDQGSTNTFTIRFTVKTESVPVFEDEYNRNYMSLSIYDRVNNEDITSYFIIDSEEFTINDENDLGILEYRLKVNESMAISESDGLYLGRMVLTYDNTAGNNIPWSFDFPEDKTICVYNPIAQNIEIQVPGDYDYGNVLSGNETINVEQTLQTNGSFSTVMTFNSASNTPMEFTSIEEMLTTLLGDGRAYVVITDQKDRTDTLQGDWTFVVGEGNSSAINISTSGQSFTFRNATEAEVTLYLRSNDSNASTLTNGQTIKLLINSTGVTGMRIANRSSVVSNIDKSEMISDVSTASISKYGAKDNTITLSDLIEFYVNNTDTETYENIIFRLNPSYLMSGDFSGDNGRLEDLFGENGMITLYSGDNAVDFRNDYSVNNMQQILLTANITSFTINKDFAMDHTIEFIISDSVGDAVNTTLNLTMLRNKQVSSVNYPSADQTIYASQGIELTNIVTDRNAGGTTLPISSLYTAGTTYYVQAVGAGDNLRYVLNAYDSAPEEYIATFVDGIITFNDFWDRETLNYTIYFMPDGDNYYALSVPIQFTISRDLKITDKEGTYYLLGSSNMSLDNFVTITRQTSDEMPSGVSIEYTFDDYLIYDGNVTKIPDTRFVFDYNVTELVTNLNIRLSGADENLATISVKVKLIQGDIYDELAKALIKNNTDGSTLSATTQIVDDVKYMMMAIDSNGTPWLFGKKGSTAEGTQDQYNTINGYYAVPSGQDAYGNNIRNYIVSGSTKLPTIMINTQSELLKGLYDESCYMVINFYSSTASTTIEATVHVPLILSSIGYDFVKYENNLGAYTESDSHNYYALANALKTPDQLYEEGIYDEMTAGQVNDILQEIEEGEVAQNKGLYSLDGFVQSIAYENLSIELTGNELIKSINISDDTTGYITFNHVSEENYYVGLKYTITKTQNQTSQEFYYLIKIIPDVVNEEVIYAYNGSVEHLSSPLGQQGSINLDSTFDSTTLNSGYKRFNVSKNVELVLDASSASSNALSTFIFDVTSESMVVKFSMEYESTTDEEPTIKTVSDIITLEKGKRSVTPSLRNDEGSSLMTVGNVVNILIMSGEGYVYYGQNSTTSAVDEKEIIFSSLNEKNEIDVVTINGEEYRDGNWSSFVDLSFSNDYSIFYFTPKDTGSGMVNSISVRIKHTYVAGNGENDFSVIGGEQYYDFIINDDTTNYSIRYTSGSTSQDSTDYVWNINNSDAMTDSSKELTINLVANSTGSSSDTIVFNKADVVLTEGQVGTNGDIASYSYDSSTGEFIVNLNSYIDSDRVVKFSVYTELGYLSTLTLNLKANAGFAFEEGQTNELTGGQDYNFNDLFNITLNNNETTSYTVTAEIEGTDLVAGGDKFIIWEDNSIKTSDLLEDKEITIKFIVTFTEENYNGNQFIFTQNFVLKQNITSKSSFASNVKTISGQEHEIILGDLYTGTLNHSKIEITDAYSSINAFNGLIGDNETGYKIDTNYVSGDSSLEVQLTIKITSLLNENISQSYTLTYSFPIYRSAILDTNYPTPTEDYTEKVEYLNNNTEFDSILANFFNHAPIFGNYSETGENIDETGNAIDNRMYAQAASLSGNDVVYNTPETISNTDSTFAITVSSVQNAYVQNATTGTNYEANETIATDAHIKFVRGNLGTESIVEFTLTYQNVSETYTVKILDRVITTQVNRVSNYSASGIYTDGESNESTVDYETIYVDKTSTDTLFAESRMAKVTLNTDIASSIGSNGQQYYFVFATRTIDGYDVNWSNFTASYPVHFSVNDIGKSLTVDLGYSMADKEFYGLYLATTFNNNLYLSIGDNGAISNTGDVTVKDALDSMSNLSNSIFANGVTIASRIELYYAGSYKIDYDKINFKDSTIVANNITEIDVIYAIEDVVNSIKTLDGATTETSNVSTNSINLNYYYMPSIDIDVENQITSGGKLPATMYVNETEQAVEYLGIKHPTTGQLVTMTDFTSGSATLSISILEGVTAGSNGGNAGITDDILNILQEGYFSRYNISKFTNTAVNSDDQTFTSETKEYLARSPMQVNDKAYDYELYPLGAKNSGDYVLLETTYSTGGFTKTFYTVVFIMPNYNVQYGTRNGVDNGDYITNIDNPYSTSSVNSSNQYSSFTLLGGDSDTRYFKISPNAGEHAGEDYTQYFKISLTENQIYDSITYNNPTNVTQKLKLSSPNWSKSNTTYTFTNKNTSIMTFSGIPQVVFGSQYFMVEGYDMYDYKFQIAFRLDPPQGYTSPSPVEETISLTELGYFDIGAQYQLLTISETGSTTSNGLTELSISGGAYRNPTDSDGVTMITLQGIKAWLFGYDYTASENGGYLVNASGGGYTLKTSGSGDDTKNLYSMSDTDLTYLNINNLMLKYITVESISFYDEDTLEILAFNGTETELTPTFAENVNEGTTNGYHLATINTLSGSYNGLNEAYDEQRAGYTNPSQESTEESTELYIPFQVPRFTDTSIFASSNTANIRMVITLKYENNGQTEYYDCPINVQLTREIELQDNNIAVRDGEAFSVSQAFNVTSASQIDTTITPTYINDTLEVMVKSNLSTTFTISLTRDGETYSVDFTQRNIGMTYDKTYYISLSQQLGINVQANDTITIIPQDNNYVGFYYISGNGADTQYLQTANGTNDISITISTITNDTIFIDDASMLANGKYYRAEKYYIAQVELGGQSYSYRVSNNYFVTGKYYSIGKSYAGEFAYALQNNDETSLTSWLNKSYGLTLNSAQISNGGVSVGNPFGNDQINSDFLNFSIDPTTGSGATGRATIDNNGSITISDFGRDEYIRVIINMAVSGQDRDITKNADATFIELGDVQLGAVRP